MLDAPLLTGDFPSEREVEGFWQFAGARIGIGLRSSSNTELNQDQDGFDSAPPCEDLDLTDFVRGLEELKIPYEEFSENGLASRRFKYRSSEFYAWLVVSRLNDRWKFCAGGIEHRDQAGETTGVRAVTIARESGSWGMLDSFRLKLPFTTELVGTRFNSKREPIGVLLVASLSLAQIEAKLRQAGHKFSKNLEFASEVWTTTLEIGGNADIYGCRVVQLGPSRCVIMVTKEPS